MLIWLQPSLPLNFCISFSRLGACWLLPLPSQGKWKQSSHEFPQFLFSAPLDSSAFTKSTFFLLQQRKEVFLTRFHLCYWCNSLPSAKGATQSLSAHSPLSLISGFFASFLQIAHFLYMLKHKPNTLHGSCIPLNWFLFSPVNFLNK